MTSLKTTTTRTSIAPVTFAPQKTFAAGSYPNSVSVADVNGDGNADVVTANWGSNNVSLLLGDGKGSFAPQTTFAVGSTPYFVSVADVNGDGKLDLVTANSSGNNVSVLLGDGKGSFAPQTTFAVGSSPISVSVADMNGDGKMDLVTANSGSVSVSVLLGDGKGGFAPQTTFAVGSSPNSVSVADVNGDGKLDLVTANYGYYGNVSVLLGDGKGSFAPQTTFAAGTSPTSLNVADVNVDGKLDLVTANYGSNVSVLLGDGKGSFAPQTTFAVGSTPYFVSVADVNGDGKLDLVTANSDSGNVSVLLGDGKGGFAPPTTFAAGSNPGSVSVADVNGDGKMDLVTSNSQSNDVSVLLNTSSHHNNNVSKGSLTIDGTLQQNKTLTVSNKLSDVDGLGTISYQWQSNNVDILGATQSTYALTQSDVGKIIGVRASYTDKLGMLESVTSSIVGKVKNVNDLPTGSVTISGEAKEEKTLTASNTLADTDGLGTISYQWQADGKIISGATSPSYTLTPAEHGKAISVKASYTDGQGTKESVTSKPTDLVTNHAPTGEIVINGDAKVGEVLSVTNTLADVDGLGDFSYQWLINGGVVSNTDTFVVPESTVGKIISVTVSYFDGEGTNEVVVSKPTLAVSAASSMPTFGNDKLVGTDKNDTLSALAGNDTLIGGLGADTLTGGQGADVFKFNSATETGLTSATRDVITDFNSGEGDKIDVSAIANWSWTPFSFIGNQAFTAGWQLRFDSTSHILYGSTNADNKPEFSIQLNGVSSLVAGDFVL